MNVSELLRGFRHPFVPRCLQHGAFLRAIGAVREAAMRQDTAGTRFGPAGRHAAALIVASCIVLAPGLRSAADAADRNPNSDFSILVVVADDGGNMARRSGPIVKAALATLVDVLTGGGFHVKGEEAIDSDNRWKAGDGRSRRELIRKAKLIPKTNLAEHQIRALLIFDVHKWQKFLPSLTKVKIEISGEIHDLFSNEILGTFHRASKQGHVPPPSYRGGGECRHCEEKLKKLAVATARSLGPKILKILADYRQGEGGRGLETMYTVKLQNFERLEALTLVRVMADKDKFPGSRKLELISQEAAIRRYSYITSAKPNKIEERIAIQLRQMNFDPDKEIITRIRGNRIDIQKIAGTPRPSKSDNGSKPAR